MKVSHAEAARYGRLAAELARIAEHRPATAEDVEAGRAAQLRRYAPTRRPPVSTLTGRPTPELPEAFYRLGPLPLDPVEGAAECRRRQGLPPRSI